MTEASQTAAILKHLQAGHAITPLEALRLFGSFRLGARIYDLRKQGYNIRMELVAVGGEGKRVGRYRLVPQATAIDAGQPMKPQSLF